MFVELVTTTHARARLSFTAVLSEKLFFPRVPSPDDSTADRNGIVSEKRAPKTMRPKNVYVTRRGISRLCFWGKDPSRGRFRRNAFPRTGVGLQTTPIITSCVPPSTNVRHDALFHRTRQVAIPRGRVTESVQRSVKMGKTEENLIAQRRPRT